MPRDSVRFNFYDEIINIPSIFEIISDSKNGEVILKYLKIKDLIPMWDWSPILSQKNGNRRYDLRYDFMAGAWIVPKNHHCDRTEKRGRGASCRICNARVDHAPRHTSTTFSIATFHVAFPLLPSLSFAIFTNPSTRQLETHLWRRKVSACDLANASRVCVWGECTSS